MLSVRGVQVDGLDDGFAVALTIEPGTLVPSSVASLTITVSKDETFSQSVPLSAPFAEIGHESLLYRPLPGHQQGAADFDVVASDVERSTLGSGYVDVPLTAGETTSVTLTLFADLALDLGQPNDLSVGPDLAGPQVLTVAVDTGATDMGTGNPQGKVTSDVGSIDCGTSCTATLTGASMVTLTASTTVGTGTWFSGWGGDCASSGNQPTCTLVMTQPRNVTKAEALRA